MTLIEALPTFITSATLEQYRTAFDSVQCVCFKKVDGINVNTSSSSSKGKGKTRKRKRTRKHKDKSISTDKSSSNKAILSFQQAILTTFQSASSKDQDSWAVENVAAGVLKSSTSASDFLSRSAVQNGYCSFVLHEDSDKAISNFIDKHDRHPSLPLSTDNKSQKQQIADTISIATPYWFFVGRNNNPRGMKGRNEHTDDIEHNGGTFHYQVAGSKTWIIRPTEELRDMCDEIDIALKDRYVHTVEEGDIFVINTRLWWHQTEIPAFAGTKKDGSSGCHNLSISYARDVWLDGKQPAEGQKMHMSSKDGSWATAFIPRGAVLLTDADPPISRTYERADANCELVVVGEKNEEEEGEEQLALVPLRDIKEGEFFIILETTENTIQKGGKC